MRGSRCADANQAGLDCCRNFCEKGKNFTLQTRTQMNRKENLECFSLASSQGLCAPGCAFLAPASPGWVLMSSYCTVNVNSVVPAPGGRLLKDEFLPLQQRLTRRHAANLR